MALEPTHRDESVFLAWLRKMRSSNKIATTSPSLLNLEAYTVTNKGRKDMNCALLVSLFHYQGSSMGR